MVLVFVAIIFLAFCGGLSKSFPARMVVEVPTEGDFQRGLSADSANEEYGSYYSVSDNKQENERLNVISQIQRVDLNKIKYNRFYHINGESYLIVKTSRHRNKRFSSYLTLCPFKICSMGRKRTRARRYIKAITTAQDNEGT